MMTSMNFTSYLYTLHTGVAANSELCKKWCGLKEKNERKRVKMREKKACNMHNFFLSAFMTLFTVFLIFLNPEAKIG